jgi:acetyl esterase/lipase
MNRDRLRILAASYLHDADPADPYVSPVVGDLHGLPPLLVQAAENEALVDDATRLARAARAAGVDVTLRLVPDSVTRSCCSTSCRSKGKRFGSWPRTRPAPGRPLPGVLMPGPAPAPRRRRDAKKRSHGGVAHW